MEIKIIEYDFSVCKIEDITGIDFNDEFCFIGKTDEEISLVCITEHVPANVILTKAENYSNALKVLEQAGYQVS